MQKNTKVAFLQKEWEDNVGMLIISALLKKNGFTTRVFVEDKRTYAQLLEFKPDVVAYPCMTGQQDWIFSSIEKIKSIGINAKFLMGGPHATFFPEVLENSPLDVICVGEGEYATLEYINALENGTDPYGIQNLHFKVDGKIIKNPLRPLIENLDELPYPDRSYYDDYGFLATNPYRIFITSRGCPYKCTFCFNHALFDLYGKGAKYIRRRSVENVMGELIEVNSKYKIDEIRFSDDHFVLDARWLKDFAVSFKEKVNRPYTVNARVDIMDEEKTKYLKESGCRLVCFGIETGREDLRNAVLKKKIKNEQIFRAADLLKKYKLKFLTTNIIGLPNEKPEDAWETIYLNQKIGTYLPWYSMMQYYPKTQIYEEARQLGILLSDSIDQIKSYFDNDYVVMEGFDELKNIHSFSILVTKMKFLTPLAKFISKKVKPNKIFKLIFKVSYLLLTIRRANYTFGRVIKASKFYVKKVFA